MPAGYAGSQPQIAPRGARTLMDYEAWAFTHRNVIPFELSAESPRPYVAADDTRVEFLG